MQSDPGNTYCVPDAMPQFIALGPVALSLILTPRYGRDSACCTARDRGTDKIDCSLCINLQGLAVTLYLSFRKALWTASVRGDVTAEKTQNPLIFFFFNILL